MGAHSGSLTYKVFFVQGELPENWEGLFVERINLNAFEELDPEQEEDESIGWVDIQDPLNTRLELSDIRQDQYLNLGLRRDRFALPKDLLDAHIKRAEETYKQKNDKDRLDKYEQEDIETMVTRDLREDSLPKMRVTDVSWHLPSGRVRFWSHANKMCDLFQGLFDETFGLDVVPSSPYTNAVELGLTAERIEHLQHAEATDFVSGTPIGE